MSPTIFLPFVADPLDEPSESKARGILDLSGTHPETDSICVNRHDGSDFLDLGNINGEAGYPRYAKTQLERCILR